MVMRQLTFVEKGRLEWREVSEPRVDGSRQAIVSPVAGTTCDLDRSIIKGRAPYGGPIALGHEFVATVIDVGEAVREVVPGDLVSVPAQISCGECDRCRSGGTAFCRSLPANSMYGLGAVTGGWGGGFSDVVRVPFADAMLVRVPADVAPEWVAAASDNLTNAYEAVVPHLVRTPGARVVVGGVGATGLYAVQMAKAMGATSIDYLDHHPGRLAFAATLGARSIEVGRGKAMPALDQEYDVAVDARGEPDDLALLLRSLAPRGVCTSVSMYFRETPLPLLQMMLRGVRFEPTPTNIRAHLPDVLSLVHCGRVAPQRVTTEVLEWEALPEALAEPSMKPVFVRNVRR